MQTHEVNRIAVGDRAKAVRESLRALGKKCSLRWIYYQCQAAADVSRLDIYGMFWRWFQALWRANRSGAEFLFEDFVARVIALDEQDVLTNHDWHAHITSCSDEHADVMRWGITPRDLSRLRVELAEDIVAKRRLLAIVIARELSAERERQAA